MSHKDNKVRNRIDRLRDMQDRPRKCDTHLLKLKRQSGKTAMLKNMGTFL